MEGKYHKGMKVYPKRDVNVRTKYDDIAFNTYTKKTNQREYSLNTACLQYLCWQGNLCKSIKEPNTSLIIISYRITSDSNIL